MDVLDRLVEDVGDPPVGRLLHPVDKRRLGRERVARDQKRALDSVLLEGGAEPRGTAGAVVHVFDREEGEEALQICFRRLIHGSGV